MITINEKGFENLRVGILKLAAQDYEKALRRNNVGDAEEIEAFFLGSWGQLLSGNNGESIIRECKRRVKERAKKCE